MPAFDDKFSDEQRDAAAEARIDHGLTAKRVHELAQAGQLTYRGRKLDPFTISPSYVNDLGQKLHRRRSGQAASKLADEPHHDAIEKLRRRVVSAADKLLEDYEKTLEKRPGDAEPKRLREIIDIVRYAGQLPLPGQRAPTSATRTDDGKQHGPDQRRGPVGALLRDHRAGGDTAPSHPTPAKDNGDSTRHERSTVTDEPSNEHEHGSPGAFVSEQVARLGG